MRLLAILGILVVLASSLPPGVQAEPAKNEIDAQDGAGDVSFRNDPNRSPVPATPANGEVDLLSLKVYGESAEGIFVTLGAQDLKASTTDIQSSRTYQVAFKADGNPVSYRLTWSIFSNGFSTNNTPDAPARFCLLPDAGSCFYQRIVSNVDYTKNLLTAYIPKAALLGHNPVDPQGPAPPALHLGPGSRLTTFTADANNQFLVDHMPNTGTLGPLTLAYAVANDRVLVRLFHDANETQVDTAQKNPNSFPTVAVEPGNLTSVRLELVNTNGAKRLLDLSTRLSNPSDAAKWDLRTAPSVQVPGNETRIVNLIVNATSQVQHRDSVLVYVTAAAKGFPDEVGSLTLRLVATVPPSPARKTVYLHHGALHEQLRGTCSAGAAPTTNFCSYEHWANTLAEDPAAPNDDKTEQGVSLPNGLGEGRASYAPYPLDAKLSRDMVLDIRAPITGAFVIRTSAPLTGSLQVDVNAGTVYIGGQNVPVSAAAPGTVTAAINFLPHTEAARIKAGSAITVHAALRFSVVGASAPLMAQSPGLVAKGSSLTFPVVPDPEAAAQPAARLGDAALSMTLKGDGEEFVNPGKTRAFPVTLVNEGLDDETVHIDANLTSKKCRLSIEPGSRFKLPGGESAKFGILIKALEEGKEGDQCLAYVNATSVRDPRVRAFVLLKVTMTRGVDMPDDAGNYTVDPESSARMESGARARGGAPGLGFVTVLMVVAFLVGRRRLHP